jgi:hypothetical protein
MNTIYIPFLNPVSFYKKGAANLPQYFHKHFEDFTFEETQQQPWAQKTKYYQKWQLNDIIPLQFESNFSAISVEVLDCRDINKLTFNATQKRANKYIPGFYVYEVNIYLVDLPAGRYRLRMILGDAEYWSDWLDIKAEWPNTLLYEYSNSRYHMDVLFETGIVFRLRVEVTLGRLVPGSDDYVYTDQRRNPYTLSSTPYRGFALSMGGAKGIPDWLVDKLNFIWSCNSIFIDGRSYAKSGETKFEFVGEGTYPMRSINMEIREGINRGSKIIEPNLNTNIKLAVVNPVDSTVFGDVALGASSNIIVIKNVE